MQKGTSSYKYYKYVGSVSLIGLFSAFLLVIGAAQPALAARPIDLFEAHPPIHVKGFEHGYKESAAPSASLPKGITPAQIKAAYNLPSTGGAGTIAIVDAYDNPNVERDLNTFSAKFGLPSCTTKNGCFEKHLMTPRIRSDAAWALEAALDTQWAHAIAPNAKILLVVATTNSGTDLISAIDYARSRPDVVAISLSWGGNEFEGELQYDSHFTGPVIFAASGDYGTGVMWPAVSPNVIGVGGTTLTLSGNTVVSETAWSGSGGGRSAYETQPAFQGSFGVPQASGMRAVPDVSYNADPNTGFPVYNSFGYQGVKGWLQVGGTSAGAPQWAAMKALGGTITNSALYAAAASASYSTDFRDITSGINGGCGFICTAQIGYDYITGLGSPLTLSF